MALAHTKLPSTDAADGRWVRQAFFAPRLDKDKTARYRRSYSSSKIKYYDTSIGGNRAINPVPGFTPNADPIDKGIASESFGMGSYYSEAIDDNQQLISLQFGIPKFNALSTFFSNFYDPDMGRMVNSGGVVQNTAYTAGRLAGTLLTLPFQAFFGLNTLYNRLVSTATGKPYSKYYYMEPNMPHYWNSVQNLVNLLAADMFMAPSLKSDSVTNPNASAGRFLDKHKVVASQNAMSDLLPDIFNHNGASFNVFAIATKAQRLADAYHRNMADIAEGASTEEEYRNGVWNYLRGNQKVKSESNTSFDAYMARYIRDNPSAKVTKKSDVQPDLSIEPDTPAEEKVAPNVIRKGSSLADNLRAEARDGAAFVRFRVNYNGAVSETFSNTSKTSGLQEKMNSIASSARSFSNSVAGGNILDNPIGDTIETAIGGLKAFLSGTASSVGFTGLGALGKVAFVEMPEIYDSSEVSFASTTYKIRLHSPYGNKLSIFTNIYIPLCMLLAGTLPRQTGKASHGAPFLCRLHAVGEADVKLGMMESLSISRGEGGIGFSIDNLPTAVEVEITVKNLDTSVSVPIADSLFGSAIGFSAFDEDTGLTDYLSSLSGLSLFDQYYAMNRLELAFAKTRTQWSSLTNPAAVANYLGGTIPGKLISSIASAGSI